MAAYQQVGSFQVVDEHGKLKRNGGNVASYFCTPKGRVVHAVTGPVNPDVLLTEAQWAVDAYRSAIENAGDESTVATQLAQAHRQSASSNGQIRQIHNLLASRALPPLHAVFQNVFENILGEKVSLPGQGLDAVVDAIGAAKEQRLPILFALSRDKRKPSLLEDWNSFVTERQSEGDATLRQLAESYVVVSFPLDLMPAVSQRVGMRPFAAPDQEKQLFVVTRSDGRQLASLTGWNQPDACRQMLALGLVQEAKEHVRTHEQLKHLLPLVEQAEPALKAQVERLMQTDHLAPVRKKSLSSGAKVAALSIHKAVS